MRATFLRVFGHSVAIVSMSLALFALAACGASSEPEPTSAPAATDPPASAVSEEGSTVTETSAPSAMMAPGFELPNAKGETVSLASYAGDKNVVLVFYRGFW